jgi:hypothetical protein
MTYRLLRSYLTLAALVLVALVWPLGHFYIRSEQTRAIASLEHDAEALAAFADHLVETDATDRLPRLARDNAARTGGRQHRPPVRRMAAPGAGRGGGTVHAPRDRDGPARRVARRSTP